VTSKNLLVPYNYGNKLTNGVERSIKKKGKEREEERRKKRKGNRVDEGRR
jgi:hypothetical protein